MHREEGVLNQRESKDGKEHDECNQTHMIRRLICWVLSSVEFTIANRCHGCGNKVELVNVEVKKLLISRRSLVIQWDPAVDPSALEYVYTGR